MKHTNGPWKIGHNLRNYALQLYHRVWHPKPNEADTIAVYGPIQPQARAGWHNSVADCGPYTEQNEANARLIAAAPDLLTALTRLLNYVDSLDTDLTSDREGINACGIAIDAINKAKGVI